MPFTWGQRGRFFLSHNGIRTQKIATVNSTTTTTNYIYSGNRLVHMTQGSNWLHFFYDGSGQPAEMNFNGTVYIYVKNLQGDIVGIVDTTGRIVVEYKYDAWGRPTYSNSLVDSNSTLTARYALMLTLNPFRYRGYVYDNDSCYYYLINRYYNSVWQRFLTNDVVMSTDRDTVGNNIYLYCGNNPIIRIDILGYYWETIWDITTLSASVTEILVNPTDIMAWVGLVGDIIDVVLPGIGGIGEAIDASRAVRLYNKGEDIVRTARKAYRLADKADEISYATGTYIVLYKNSNFYIGKGGLYRATVSAKRYETTENVVSAIIWAPASNKDSAFITEYLLQSIFGVGEAVNNTYNKIYSPGKKIFIAIQ